MKRFPFPLLLAGLARAQEHPAAESIAIIRRDHGLSLALAGMLIVFCGLAGISLFIAVLPKILAGVHRLRSKAAGGYGPSASATKSPAADPFDGETLAAIAMVLHAEAERQAGQDPTVAIGLSPLVSPWALSTKMRAIPGRIKTL